MTEAQEDCIFCKVIAGKLPSYKVYEDDLFIGILDIFPRRKGHTLLIPKTHYQWVYDVPEFEQYWTTAKKLTKAIDKGLEPTFIHYLTYGFHVPHAHIHIIPHYVSIYDEEPFPGEVLVDKKEMGEIRKKIADAVKNLK
jgi:histidine triad (HIT) family protein